MENKNWKLLLYNRKSRNIWENGYDEGKTIIKRCRDCCVVLREDEIEGKEKEREGDTINNQYIIGQLQRSSITI